jgi:hypothetical protein
MLLSLFESILNAFKDCYDTEPLHVTEKVHQSSDQWRVFWSSDQSEKLFTCIISRYR